MGLGSVQRQELKARFINKKKKGSRAACYFHTDRWKTPCFCGVLPQNNLLNQCFHLFLHMGVTGTSKLFADQCLSDLTCCCVTAALTVIVKNSCRQSRDAENKVSFPPPYTVNKPYLLRLLVAKNGYLSLLALQH